MLLLFYIKKLYTDNLRNTYINNFNRFTIIRLGIVFKNRFSIIHLGIVFKNRFLIISLGIFFKTDYQ